MAQQKVPLNVKHKILYKGLVFILVPLALQMVFFAMLYQLMQRAESLAESEARQSRAVMWMDSLAVQFADGLSNIGNVIYGGKRDELTDPDAYRARMDPVVAQGREVFAGNPQMLDLVSEASQLEEEQYQLLRSLSIEAPERHSISSVIHSVMALKPALVRLGRTVNKINEKLAVQRKELERARQAEESNRRQLKTQVLLGVCGSVALTIALLIIFVSGITHRLHALVNNAQKLPRGEPLEEKVAGDDELGYLDSVLHEAAGDLKAAAQNRKQIMEMVAHDLRTPLASSGLILERLLGRMTGRSDAQDVEDVQNTKKSLSTVVNLVEDLLTIDQLESGTLALQKELIEIRPLVQESFRMLAGQSETKQVKLVNEVVEVAIDCDRQRLLQVLNNLISNAIKFSPVGATVRVTTDIAPSEIKFSVIDQGPGIPASVQARVFDRFYQESTRRGGFGLGLNIVKLIIAAHNGQVGVTSEPPNGSTFWFTLPVDVDLSDCFEPAAQP
jgi:signal transduction histidine kinase